MRIRLAFLPGVLMVLAAGCGPQTRSYTVTVKNDSSRPITVGLVKEGDPFEPKWASPEDVALVPGAAENAWDSAVVAPGKTATAGPEQGKFARNARATLRVYGDEMGLSEVLATSRGSGRRLELNLSPGSNAFRIIERDGRLAAEPLAEETAAGPAQ